MIDFEAGTDRHDLPGIDTEAQWTARATQVGEHLHIALDGGDLYLAWTTLDDLGGAGRADLKRWERRGDDGGARTAFMALLDAGRLLRPEAARELLLCARPGGRRPTHGRRSDNAAG